MDEHDPAFDGDEERGYLLARAAAHRRLAERADAPAARAIHLRLAELYEERAAGGDLVDRDQPGVRRY